MIINKINLFCKILLFTFPINQFCNSQSINDVLIDQKTKTAVISRINELVIEKYIFLDKAKEIEKYSNRKLKNGEYNKITTAHEFAFALETDLREISKDEHFRFEFDIEEAKRILSIKDGDKETIEKARIEMSEKLKQRNFGLFRAERLPGNIGYLDLRSFVSVDIDVETAVAALSFLKNSNAIIIDLRKNGGGDPRKVQLICSFFIEEHTQLNSLVYRYKENPEVQYWTIPNISGANLYDKELYILTSDFTFSAAEDFAYVMKNLKRSVIIGEKTRGGAHEGNFEVILNNFILFLPIGNTVNPITKANWEGVGVVPDIFVPQQEALDKAQLIILGKLIENEQDELNKKIYNFAYGEIKVKLKPTEVDVKTLKKYEGTYGKRSKRKIFLENDYLIYNHGTSTYKLTPISEILYSVSGVNDFQIEFSIQADGLVKGLIIVWDDGFRSYVGRLKYY